MKILQDPPQKWIDIAIDAGRASPCAKSKRGAVVYPLDEAYRTSCYTGFNGPPAPLHCAMNQPCGGGITAVGMIVNGDTKTMLNPSRCSMVAEHAEQRALIIACVHEDGSMLRGFGLIHVKVDSKTGELVAGGPPSCWQCAREVLSSGIGAVFLYEEDPGIHVVGGSEHDEAPAWVRYDAHEFHAATMRYMGFSS